MAHPSRDPLHAVALLLALATPMGALGCKRSPPKVAQHGEVLFRARCAVCHSTGEAGGQGPGLAKVVGRKAASGHGFGYAIALARSGLVWNEETLDRFLAAPSALVPATTMPISTPSADDRRALIAYLATLDGSGASTRSDPEGNLAISMSEKLTYRTSTLDGGRLRRLASRAIDAQKGLP